VQIGTSKSQCSACIRTACRYGHGQFWCCAMRTHRAGTIARVQELPAPLLALLSQRPRLQKGIRHTLREEACTSHELMVDRNERRRAGLAPAQCSAYKTVMTIYGMLTRRATCHNHTSRPVRGGSRPRLTAAAKQRVTELLLRACVHARTDYFPCWVSHKSSGCVSTHAAPLRALDALQP